METYNLVVESKSINIRDGELRVLPYLTVISLVWIYVGAVRSWILPTLSNYLYFAHFPFLLLLWYRTSSTEKKKFSMPFMLIVVIAIFQISHVILGNIQIVAAMYGLITYATPLIFIMIFTRTQISPHDLKILSRYILFTLPINFFVVFFQVVLKVPRLQQVGFTENSLLGTTNGVVRATGTFTSSAGFSFYIIFLVLILYYATRRKYIARLTSISLASILGVLTLISGSRTILFFILLDFIAILFSRNIPNQSRFKRFFSKLGILTILLGSYQILTYSKIQVLSSFSQRIMDASKTENTFQRLLDSVLAPIHIFREWTLFGRGLGAYGHGSLGYISSEWIENDLSKNILEGGLIFGGIIIITRIFVATKFTSIFFKFRETQRTEAILASITLTPLVIVGQITNQGSVMLGLCICSTLIFKIIATEVS